MDLSLSLSYNSLVWTNTPGGVATSRLMMMVVFPGPGFRLAFPVIQMRNYNSEVGKNAYVLIGSEGSRTERCPKTISSRRGRRTERKSSLRRRETPPGKDGCAHSNG
jgi:hypothetical protein